MREFRVVIDGDLSDEDVERINTSIQSAVLPHLAELGRPAPDDPEDDGLSGFVTLSRPPRWFGMKVARLRGGNIDEALRRFEKM